MRVVIVIGLSGAGKSTVLRALEDIEFYCVDNLPLPLLNSLVVALGADGLEKASVSVDARQARHLSGYHEFIQELVAAGHQVEQLFLEATDSCLLRRYSETRRLHPLSGDDLPAGIQRDRDVLGDLRHGAEVVDTTSLNVHQLKGIIQERYGKQDGSLAITLLSFGYKHGLPVEADLAFDVRFLPNPYFDAALSGRDGRDTEVAEYVYADGAAHQVSTRIVDLLEFSLPHFQREGKLYLTVAVGCTGGRHRSVALVEDLSRQLGAWDVRVRHRDLEQAG